LPQARWRFVGTDHLRAKIIINNETPDQVNQFMYLGCSISYQFSNDVELKLAKFLQLIGTIKRTIFRKVRMETILKLYNTLVLPTFLYGLGQKTGLWQPHRDEELRQQKWSYWDLWQVTPFMTTKQTTPFTANYRQTAY
jgi:hypothetical protein